MGCDPYNSIGKQCVLAFYCWQIEKIQDAFWAVIHRGSSQLLEPGYDPYNHGGCSNK